jgi:hypothetical protein
MSRKARVLKHGVCEVTQGYKGEKHKGIDIVKEGYQLDYIVAHSNGTVVAYQNNYATTDKTGNSYGNYVKIKHDEGYHTLYAHMKYQSVTVKTGDAVKKGQVIGYMGNTGHSNGGHLHFEVWKDGSRIDPTKYLEEDLTTTTPTTPTATLKYKVGDTVTINGVYVSSTSDKMYKPAKSKGKITKIVEGARNPYLLENGNIGWVNDACITSLVQNTTYKTVANCSWLNLRTSASYGNNIYKAVKAGTKLEYLGLSSGWAKVRYEGKTLYCGASYLK